jgi:hypothetical protein
VPAPEPLLGSGAVAEEALEHTAGSLSIGRSGGEDQKMVLAYTQL